MGFADELSIEQRINAFLEQEQVGAVRVTDYLKDLGVFQETQKCLKQMQHVNKATVKPIGASAIINRPNISK